MVKQLGIGTGQEVLKVRGGNLGNQRVHHSNHIHTGFNEVIAHQLAALGAESQQFIDIVLIVVHVHEQVIAAQMRSQCKGPQIRP